MTDVQNPDGLPPVTPGGSPSGQTPPGTVPANVLPPEAQERISGLTSNWQKAEHKYEQALGTIATKDNRIAELESQLSSPSISDAERHITEAELRAKTAEKENLQLRLQKALERTPNVAKAVEAGTVDLDHVTSVESLFGLESTLAAAVSEIVAKTQPLPSAPAAPVTPPSEGQPQAPSTPEVPPTPPATGSMAAPAQDPAPQRSTIENSKREALQRGIATGDMKSAVEEFFPEIKQPPTQ